MPNYTFRNTTTGETWTEFMSISERESFLKNNPNIQQEPTSPAIVDPWALGRKKPTSATNEVLKRIKNANRGSTINTGNVTEV